MRKRSLNRTRGGEIERERGREKEKMEKEREVKR